MGRAVSIAKLAGLKPNEASFVIEYSRDFNERRAAKVSGFEADKGPKLLNKREIADAIERIVEARLEAVDIDAEWVLLAAYDNYRLALYGDNINAANTALKLIGTNHMVDAFAAKRVELSTDEAIKERLQRGRERARKVSFL